MTEPLISHIPGDYIAKALQTLLPAQQADDRDEDDMIMETIIDVPSIVP